jgi:P27 family predicted phage terminase small subunit
MPRGSGRRPKPTALKKLQGNAGKRKLNEREPQPTPGAPEMPRDLSKAAAEEWIRIVPELEQLGVLTKVDRAALAAYCHAFARWFEAEKRIRKFGVIIEEPVVWRDKSLSGRLRVKVIGFRHKKNPAVTVSESAQKIMKAFLVEFGMTPSSRSRVRIEKPPGGDEDPLDAFLKGAAAPNKHVN